jgi:hypothetical protein
MRELRHGCLIIALALVPACTGLTRKPANGELPATGGSARVLDKEAGIAAFRYVHSVATGVRCVNCHVAGDRPIQLEGQARRLHPMNVQRRLNELGHQCTTCHQDRNWDQAHLPPGAPNWNMPRAHKTFDAGTFPRALCELWKDPKRNEFESGPRKEEPRSPEDLLEHVSNDPLVQWTWNPGPGRTPSAGTHAQFVAQFATWVENGAPCPDSGDGSSP